MKPFFIIFFIIIFLSCETDSPKDKFNDEEVINLKNKISDAYTLIPTFIFEANDDVDYSKYQEIRKLDSLFVLYEKYPLKEKDLQLLGIAKSKRRILVGEYTKAIDELGKLAFNEELEDYKNSLLAICYLYLEDNETKTRYFEKVLNSLESKIIKDKAELCISYSLVSFLNDSANLKICQSKSSLLNEFEQREKREVIISYFLNILEL